MPARRFGHASAALAVAALLTMGHIGEALAQDKAKIVPQWRDPKNPKILKLDKNWDVYFRRRDRSKDPKREAGPINLQRYKAVPSKMAFPTYMGLPVALTKEDLVAGKVDVAIVGLPSDVNPVGGAGWAANQMRIIRTFDWARDSPGSLASTLNSMATHPLIWSERNWTSPGGTRGGSRK